MNDPLLKDLLNYHQPLNDVDFSRQLLAKIKRAERQRRLIMWVFTLFGLCLSTLYLWSILPLDTWLHWLTPVNGLLLFGIGIFMIWLWTEERSIA